MILAQKDDSQFFHKWLLFCFVFYGAQVQRLRVWFPEVLTEASLIKVTRISEYSEPSEIRPQVSLFGTPKMNSHLLKFGPTESPKGAQQVSGKAGISI